jgi:hypothetical protein
MLGACSTVYQYWESSRTVETAPASHAASSQAPTAEATPGPSASLQAPETPAGDGLNIKLSAVENTWLSLAADGHEVFKGTLRVDESKTLEGRQSAQVRTGNAGGLEVVFTGRPLGKLGGEGQTRTVVFTKDSYNVLHAGLPMALATIIRGLE